MASTDEPSVDDYIDLDARVTALVPLNETERARYEKGHFRWMTGLQLDQDMIGQNLDGRLLERIGGLAEVLEVLLKDKHDTLRDALNEALRAEGRLKAMEKKYLIAILLTSARIATPDGLSAGEVTLGDLELFCGLCLKNRTIMEETLAVKLRSDVKANPVRQLNDILRMVGLRMVQTTTLKVKGVRVRKYSFDPAQLDRMLRLAGSFRQTQKARRVSKEAA